MNFNIFQSKYWRYKRATQNTGSTKDLKNIWDNINNSNFPLHVEKIMIKLYTYLSKNNSIQ